MSSDKINALLHVLSIDRNVIQIPGEKFKVRLSKLLPRGKNPDTEIKNYKEKYFIPRQKFLKTITLKISPLSIGLYNATVDTKHLIDIKKILEKVKEIGLVSDGGIKVTEFKIKYGKFQTALSYTSEYGLVGDETKNFVSADFKLKITKGGETKGASFSYYKTGRIRFSGGHLDSLTEEPRELLQFFAKHYYDYNISAKTDIKLNNVTSEFKVGFPLKTSLIYDIFSDPFVKSFYDNIHVIAKYEKKFLYIEFEKEFSVIISDTGIIQIQGTTDVEDAYVILKKFFEVLKNNDLMVISANKTQNSTLQKPKKTKIARRLDDLPAPNITRRGTTCPVGRRPDPYSYTGTCTQKSCYIKPNPQGQPCCYSIPKSTEYSRNKVEAAYKKAGVKVPDSIRSLFGVGHQTNNRPNNVAKKGLTLSVRAYVNNKKGFKIDTRQCLRYTKVALVDMATRLKIILPTKITKPILCDLIKKASNLPNVNVKAGDKGAVVSGSNKTLRLGNRVCTTYPRNTLVKFAQALGGSVPTTFEKAEICSLIEKLSIVKRKQLQNNFNKHKVARDKEEEARKKNIENQKLKNEEARKKAIQNKKNQLVAENNENTHPKKARLTRSLVKEDLMGMLNVNTVDNKNVDSLMNTINKAIKTGVIKKDKHGKPMKSYVNKVKRTFGLEMIRLEKEKEQNNNFNYFMRGPRRSNTS